MRGRAVVIGRGVIGSAVALELARDGWAVVAVDRHGAAGHGSTSGSSGVIRTYYSSREGTALAWEGFHAWRDFGAHVGAEAAPFRELGCLVLGDAQRGQRAIADELGIPHAWWDADAIRARLPHFDLARFAPPKRPEAEGFGQPTGGVLEGGVWWPCSGYVADPMRAAQHLWDAAARAGARAVRGEVVAVPGAARVRGVVLEDGTKVAGDVVVNVAGPGARRINALAGVEGDMVRTSAPMRQEVVHLPPVPGSADGVIVVDGDVGLYSRPERGGTLAGTTEPECDALVWVEDERAFERDFSDQWDVQAMRYGQRVPSQGIPRRRAGVVEMYDVSDDWIPIYDRSARPGFYMACGTSGNQFKNAPVAGRLMAAIVDHCERGGDQDAAPLRLVLPRTGTEIDTGFFSRLRAVHAESSMSVLG